MLAEQFLGGAPAPSSLQRVLVLEVLRVDREVLEHHLSDAVEPVLLVGRESLAGGDEFERALDAFSGSEQRLILVRGVLDHRDDVHERLLVAHRVGFLELLRGEPVAAARELLAQLLQGTGAPVPRPVE